MFNNIIAAGEQSGGGNQWIMLVVLGVLMVGMILMSIIPQRKRQKQAQEMMAGLKKGDKVKTIGGFVGVIVGIDNGNNTLRLDMSVAEDGSILVNIDKSAVYTVMNAVPEQNFDESKTVDAGRGENVVTADDLEADEKAKVKKDKKNRKKEAKAAVAPDNAEIAEVAEVADVTDAKVESSDVEPTVDAKDSDNSETTF